MANATEWRNRIVGTGEESPTDLVANPLNWRTHPKHQQEVLAAVLSEVGWVQNVVVNRISGRIIDGHLRVSLALERKEEKVPVVFVELSELEERLVLATIDPLSALAETDSVKLDSLLREVETGSSELQGMLADLAAGVGLYQANEVEAPTMESGERAPFRQCTFTLHDKQFEVVEAAMSKAKEQGGGKSELNENSNGNALTWICVAFNKQANG